MHIIISAFYDYVQHRDIKDKIENDICSCVV